MIGDLVRVNRDGLCIKKGTIVEVRAVDVDDTLKEKGLIGSTRCRPLNDDQFDGGIWCEHLDPLLLTPKILEKNGFVSKDFFAELVCGDYRILSDAKHIAIIHGDHADLDIPICFVHELQHCLKRVGIDNEIAL